MSRPRDSQRSKIYSIEDALAFPEWEYELLRPWTDKIFRSKYWKKISDKEEIASLLRTTYYTSCMPKDTYSSSIVLRLEPYRFNQLGVLHGLAHSISPANEAWHGPTFAKNYLQLVRRFLGKETATQFSKLYREKKVKHRVISEDKLLERKIQVARAGWGEFLSSMDK